MTTKRRKVTYEFPDLTGWNVVYKGRRYKVIELEPDRTFDGWMTTADYDYVMWDGEYNSHLALIKKKDKGGFRGHINAHVDLWYDYNSIRDAVNGLAADMDRYCKAISR
jgi:hypothetical protein